MAQNDFAIPNQGGQAFRLDVQDALQSLAGHSSGATDPNTAVGTTYPYQFWADTSNSVMKMRNGADSAWIELFQLDGEWSTIAFENGTAAAPSIYFKDSGTDTGFYSPGANQVGISTGGTSALVVDSSGRLLVGTSSALDASSEAIVHVANGLGARLVLARNDTSVTEGNGLGGIRFAGNDTTGNTFTNLGEIVCQADGTHAAGDNPTRLVFSTTPTGSSSPTTQMTIDSSGRLLVGTSSTTQNDVSIVVQKAGGGKIYLARDSAPPIDGNIGFLSFGDNGHTAAASIAGHRDGGTWTSGSSQPTRLEFSTTADGASSPTERMRINSDGTTRFYYRIYSTPVYNNAVTGRDVYINSNGEFGYLSSTAASKANIASISNVDWIYDLNPVSFNYKAKDEEGNYTDEVHSEKEYGLIADEVESIAPELCFYDETEEGATLTGISYRKLFGPMLKALQQQKELIETLEAKVAALEAQ